MIDDQLRATYAQRRQHVDTYERTWWLDRNSFTAAHPDRYAHALLQLSNNQPVDSDGFYQDDNREWFDERVLTHHGVLNNLAHEDLLARGIRYTHTIGANRPTPSGPVYFLIGLPGSGKTHTLRPIALDHAGVTDAAVSDADGVRTALPEYSDGLGSRILQNETAYLTYDDAAPDGGRQRRVLSQDAHVAFVDVIGDPTWLPQTIAEVHANGREAYVLMTHCDPDLCIERVMRRAVDDGRYVSTTLVSDKVGVPEHALAAALATGLLAGWAVVDTTDEPNILDGDDTFSIT